MRGARQGVVSSQATVRVIVRAAIHPAIGIARVGDSLTEFYLGPQVTEPASKEPGFYRDATGALKRQAAEFRIYGYNAAGEVVDELTADSADIVWTVHVANRKAQWYQFQLALDIPDAAGKKMDLRNKNIPKTERGRLAIDPGPRSIRGKSVSGGDEHLNQVLTEDEYRIVMNTAEPREVRLAAFNNREHWTRGLPSAPVDAMMKMVAHFSEMGVVEARPGIPSDPDFPAVIYVESIPPKRVEALRAHARLLEAAGPPVPPTPAQLAGWENEAHREAFAAIRLRFTR